jgi:hypothetical protein
LRREILRSRLIGFRLTLLFGNRLVDAGSVGFGFFDVGANIVSTGFVAGLTRFERRRGL